MSIVFVRKSLAQGLVIEAVGEDGDCEADGDDSQGDRRAVEGIKQQIVGL